MSFYKFKNKIIAREVDVDRMSQLAGQAQQMPKLAKTKQLQNPYHSSTSPASLQLPRIFLLNDRNKVKFTEQSESEEQPADTHYISSLTNRLLTFGGQKKPESLQQGQCSTQANQFMNAPQIGNQKIGKQKLHGQQLQIKQTPTIKMEEKYSQQKIQQTAPNLKEVGSKTQIIDEQGISFNKKDQKQKGNEQGLKSLEGSKHSGIKESRNGSIKSSGISHLHGQGDEPSDNDVPRQQVEEQVAQEQDMEVMWSKQTSQHHLNISVAHSKPSLHQASRVGELDQDLCRGSIIDRIKGQSFIQSRVLDNDKANSHYNNGIIANNVTSHHMPREATSLPVQFRQQESGYKNQIQTQLKSKPRQRIKIFDNLSAIKHNMHVKDRPSGLTMKESKPTSFSPFSRSTHLNERQLGHTQTRVMHEQTRVNYAVCPHTQCILKSLQIIDKLTVPAQPKQHQNDQEPQNRSQVMEPDSAEMLKQEIQSESLDISMRVDQLLVELVLADLLEEETGIKIRKLKYQVQQLINKIKAKEDQGQLKKDNTSRVTKASKLQYRWQLCDQMQKICKSLHFLQIVQQRYKMWKIRLHHLSERIKDILKVDKQQQVKKLSDIATHIQQLQNSKFYGTQALEIGVVEAYNNYIQRESEELKFTMQWIKSDIVSG